MRLVTFILLLFLTGCGIGLDCSRPENQFNCAEAQAELGRNSGGGEPYDYRYYYNDCNWFPHSYNCRDRYWRRW